MRRIFATFCLTLLTSCSNKEMNGGVSSGVASSGSKAGQAVAPVAATPTNAEQKTMPSEAIASEETPFQGKEEEVVDEAMAPQVVAGAFLNCKLTGSKVGCLTVDANQAARDYGMNQAYVIRENLIWTEIAFQTLGPGSYNIDLPAGFTGPFAIGFSNEKNEILADWVVMPNPTINLVRDGSFEGYSLPGPQTTFVANSNHIPWRALAGTVGCPQLVVEVSYGDGALDGNHLIDLNSTCTGAASRANDILLTQTISPLAGNFYQMIYHTREHHTHTGDGGVIARVDGQVWDLFKTQATTWQERSIVKRVDKSGAQDLSFQDGALDGSDSGILLDDVRFLNLGKGPQ